MFKDHNFIALHMIVLEDNIHENMTEFHAFTGCDATSQFAGIGQKSALSVFKEFLNTIEPSKQRRTTGWGHQFNGWRIENLPPTPDALTQHIRRQLSNFGMATVL